MVRSVLKTSVYNWSKMQLTVSWRWWCMWRSGLCLLLVATGVLGDGVLVARNGLPTSRDAGSWMNGYESHQIYLPKEFSHHSAVFYESVGCLGRPHGVFLVKNVVGVHWLHLTQTAARCPQQTCSRSGYTKAELPHCWTSTLPAGFVRWELCALWSIA